MPQLTVAIVLSGDVEHQNTAAVAGRCGNCCCRNRLGSTATATATSASSAWDSSACSNTDSATAAKLLQPCILADVHAHIQGACDEYVGHTKHQERQHEQTQVQHYVVEPLVALVRPNLAALAVACARGR